MRHKRFEVRVYHNNGDSRGMTVLEAANDQVDGRSVDTIELAEEYARQFLVREDEYAIVK